MTDAPFELTAPAGRDRVHGSDVKAGHCQSAIRAGVVAFEASVTEAQVDRGVISEKAPC